jgi:hypothetical protein
VTTEYRRAGMPPAPGRPCLPQKAGRQDRAAAEAKVAELLATRKTGTLFLQMVKEPMPEDAAPAAADK